MTKYSLRNTILCNVTFMIGLLGATVMNAQGGAKPRIKTNLSMMLGNSIFSDVDDELGFGHHYSFRNANPLYRACFSFDVSLRSSILIGIHRQTIEYDVDYDWVFIDALDPLMPVSKRVKLDTYEIPLYYQFKFINRDRNDFFALAGIQPSLFVGSKGTIEYADGNEQTKILKHPSYNSYYFGLGWLYEWVPNFRLRVESGYRFYNNGFEANMAKMNKSLSIMIGIDVRIDWKCFFKKEAWNPFPICD